MIFWISIKWSYVKTLSIRSQHNTCNMIFWISVKWSYLKKTLSIRHQWLTYIPVVFCRGHELDSLRWSPCHLQNVGHWMGRPAVITIQFQALSANNGSSTSTAFIIIFNVTIHSYTCILSRLVQILIKKKNTVNRDILARCNFRPSTLASSFAPSWFLLYTVVFKER